VFLRPDGRRLDRHGAARIVRRSARRAAIGMRVGPHTLRHALITAALDAGCRCATCTTPHRTPTARASLRRHATCIVAAYVAC
jgi:integrase/recombinase XerD